MRNGTRSSLSSLVVAGIALGALTGPHAAFAEWPPCGRAISTAPNGQVHASIAPDGAGGAIVTWQDFRSKKINVFAQHVLASGELDAAWPADGQAVLADSFSLANEDGHEGYVRPYPRSTG